MRTPSLPALLSVVMLSGALVGGTACSTEPITSVEKDFFIAGHKGHGVELIRRSATGRTLVQWELRLKDAAGEDADVIKMLAELDRDGNVRSASFRREGRKGRRYVELRRAQAGGLELVSRGNDETQAVPAGRVRVTELAEFQPGAFDIEIELANASLATAPPLDDVVRPADRAPGLFIESGAPSVAAWCKQQTAEPDPLVASRQLLQALKPKLARENDPGPPSALNAIAGLAWDQGGAALLTACFRVLGHPARVVSGRVDSVSAPRTWAQVHDGTRFVDVDPLEEPGVHTATRVGFRDAFFTRTP